MEITFGNHSKHRLVLLAFFLAAFSALGGPTNSWRVFRALPDVQDASLFDGCPVSCAPPKPAPFDSAACFTLASGDGLQVQVAQDGGVIEEIADGPQSLQAAGMDYASGWFICDRAAGSDWWNVGGWVTAADGILRQHGVIPQLNLSAEVRYSVTNQAIRMEATVSNLVAGDRAITLYLALPVAMQEGWWWNTPRERVPLSQSVESSTLTEVSLGARNQLSQYPLATVADRAALTLAVPPEQYRPFRLAYNRLTRQFYAAFDLGLSAVTARFPQKASVELWLYRSDPAWGLRSGLAGFYRRFPCARSFTNEGLWVAFTDLHTITNISDFGIAYHEINDPKLVKFDNSNNIQPFRYLSEPWSYWMRLPAKVDNTDYGAVYKFLLAQAAQGVADAIATLSSAVRDDRGLLKFAPAAQPWCPYGAVFSLNGSPFIADEQFPVTKFSKDWNRRALEVYNQPEQERFKGEYIDSFGSSSCFAVTTPDYSSNHLRTTSFPLAYTRDNFRLMTPLIFGTYEMSRAIAADLHAAGRPIMANTLFTWPYLPLGIGLFDFGGNEVNWFDPDGHFIQPSDSSLLYARALSGQRPYGCLLNSDFSKVSPQAMEDYMRVCAVYAIYPSAMSADAMDNYFAHPALYERDRALFKKYVPLIRAMSLAGWQPVTGVTCDNSLVALESYGTNGPLRYLTVRNLSANRVAANATFDTANWGRALVLSNLFDGAKLGVNVAEGLPLTLDSYECRAYAVQAGAALKSLPKGQ